MSHDDCGAALLQMLDNMDSSTELETAKDRKPHIFDGERVQAFSDAVFAIVATFAVSLFPYINFNQVCLSVLCLRRGPHIATMYRVTFCIPCSCLLVCDCVCICRSLHSFLVSIYIMHANYGNSTDNANPVSLAESFMFLVAKINVHRYYVNIVHTVAIILG